jgi:hypothetical protein
MKYKKPQILWNSELSEDKHFHDNKIKYYFLIYNSSYHESIKDKILNQFKGFEFFQGFGNFEQFYGKVSGTVMKYLSFSFETSRIPKSIDWEKVTSIKKVRIDKNLTEKNKIGIENYVSDLFLGKVPFDGFEDK